MKLIFTLVSSLVLAGLLCLLLVAKGVVQITDDVENANLQSSVDEGIEQVSATIEQLPLNIIEEPLDESIHAQPSISNNVQVIDVHSGILLYLDKQQTNSNGAQLEEELYGLLVEEFGLNSFEAAQYVQMCFWRYFVTFQQPLPNKDKQLLWQDFIKEKELKQAGFKARGLEFPVREIKAAEEQFEIFKERSEQQEIDGGKA